MPNDRHVLLTLNITKFENAIQMMRVPFSNGGRPIPCLGINTVLVGVVHKGSSEAFGGGGNSLHRNRVSQIGSSWMERRELLVENVELAQVTDLECMLEVVFHSYFALVLDGDGWIVVSSFGTGHQQKIR